MAKSFSLFGISSSSRGRFKGFATSPPHPSRLIERGFHRLKGVPLSLSPLFVKRDDQVVGLTNLLSLGVRFLTLIEFVVRRKLNQNQEKLAGLIENNPKKGIGNPTTERLLKMFDIITLTISQLPDQTIRNLPVLTAVQVRILELLGLSADVYNRLADNGQGSNFSQRMDSDCRIIMTL